jgi:formate C-acetyltransferase
MRIVQTAAAEDKSTEIGEHSGPVKQVGFASARLDRIKVTIRDGKHKALRQQANLDLPQELDESLSWPHRVSTAFCRILAAEEPVILPDERFAFTRTTTKLPPVYEGPAWRALTRGRTVHESGPISNICADWNAVLRDGLLERRRRAMATRERARDQRSREFLDCAILTIDAVLDLAARYAAAAHAKGRDDIGTILDHVPARTPRSFREALQALRFLHAMVWLEGHHHVGLGRLDQYLWPYLEHDLADGRLSLAEAEELLAEFFILLNKDSDVYPGVQQGDNGQTVMLGGVRSDGTDAVNELTRMALRVALYTNMIDPKINLRITSRTDLALLELAAELTRQGLGFPQYSNDTVVIPALVGHGYALEDAREYVVAACWEFIIPGKGMEVVNIGAVSLPLAVDHAIRRGLANALSFAYILDQVKAEISQQVQILVDQYQRLVLPPAPWYSVLMDGCLETARDLSEGLTYNNFGLHAAAAANAADALAAVKHCVFDQHSIAASDLLAALDADFAGHEALRRHLLDDAPKTCRDDEANDLMVRLLDFVAEACEAITDNGRGGHIRPGTGSAMYYVWLARGKPGEERPPIGATADGRRTGDLFGANLAPSLQVVVRGPFSVLQTFSRIDYQRVMNGGPITLELSDITFQDADSLVKCAMLVRTFARLGCQQLQLNTLNVDTLFDAKLHPETHRNLIVRVWGWSGYFCELAPEYQDHVIARHLYQL